jgi:peptidoglycan/xylan/chitin deacetylase (PgdA/CDA1 family)
VGIAVGLLAMSASAVPALARPIDAHLEAPTTRAAVDWNKGGGPAQMSKGLPNPPGWYQAAVGPRTADKVLYLTFDDGPSPHTARLLASLRRHDARATFFVAGGPAQSSRADIRRMRRDGHAIGNHTWWHPRLTEVSTPRIRKELTTTRRAVGRWMGPCMRPPYGLIDARVARTSISLGFQPVLWTAHIEDWVRHPARWTVQRLRKNTKPGAVILMHDTHAQTVTAVRKMLPTWRERGYRLEVVPACA